MTGKGYCTTLFPLFDVWRILCASLVVLSHAGQLELLPSIGTSLMAASHHAVIIFFVISGFSVAYSAAKENSQLQPFLSARLSRILSVAIPAIFITLVIDLIGQSVAPGGTESWQLKSWWLYLALHSVFAGELWFWSIHPFSNVPFWSLNYEVYYYLFFAATLIKNPTWRVLSIMLIGLIVGPKIWLLLPCWWLGVSLFRHLRTHTLGTPAQSSLGKFALPSIVFVIAYLAFSASGFSDWSSQLVAPFLKSFYYSKNFIGDTVIALLFVVCAAWHAKLNANNSFKLNPSLAKLAPHTFALYALHYPLLNLLAGTVFISQPEAVNVIGVLLVAAVCVAIGSALAPTRIYWRNAIAWIFNAGRTRR
jgi:peptidoglycan/LPS O-acetylase OafA/YrhL